MKEQNEQGEQVKRLTHAGKCGGTKIPIVLAIWLVACCCAQSPWPVSSREYPSVLNDFGWGGRFIVGTWAQKFSRIIGNRKSGVLLLEETDRFRTPSEFSIYEFRNSDLVSRGKHILPVWGPGFAPAADGGFITVGVTNTIINIEGLPQPISGPFVARYNSGFRLLWAVELAEQGQLVPNGAVEDTGGGVVVQSVGPGATSVQRLDRFGERSWTRVITNFQSMAIAAGLNGSIILGGSMLGTNDNGAGIVVSRGMTDGLIVSVNANGNVDWNAQLGGPFSDAVSDVAVDAAGRVGAVGVFTRRAQAGDRSLEAFGGVGRDAFAASLGTNGAFLWVRSFGGLQDEDVGGVAASSDGALMMTVQVVGSKGSDSSMLLDPNGGVLWTKNFPTFSSGNGSLRTRPIIDQSGAAYCWSTATGDLQLQNELWFAHDRRGSATHIELYDGQSLVGFVTPQIGTPENPPIEFFAGVRIHGPIGRTVRIDYRHAGMADASWSFRTNVTLTSTPMVWVDMLSAGEDVGVYRTELLP